jgi:hypothetical protein
MSMENNNNFTHNVIKMAEDHGVLHFAQGSMG